MSDKFALKLMLTTIKTTGGYTETVTKESILNLITEAFTQKTIDEKTYFNLMAKATKIKNKNS